MAVTPPFRPVDVWLRFAFGVLLLLSQAGVLRSAQTRRVPLDFPSIKSAVLASGDGDTVEIDDGYYFEDNIIIDKALRLKAKNALSVVLYGSETGKTMNAIFWVRATAEFEGFILKNGMNGIVQRESPDVRWTAHDLVILNMRGAAVSINDMENNIGQAVLSNIIVDRCDDGFVTNDAHSMEVKNCLVANCKRGFVGFDHLTFRVERTLVWNCEMSFYESEGMAASPRTHAISRGGNIEVLGPGVSDKMAEDNQGQYFYRFFVDSGTPGNKTTARNGIREGLVLAIAGNVYFRLHDYARSAEFFKGSLRLGLAVRSDELIWQSHYGLARACENRQDISSALEQYRKAIVVLDGLREKLPLRVYNPGFFQDKMEVYTSFIHFLFMLHEKNPSRIYLEEAFACAEKSRARGFLDSFKEASVDLKLPQASDLREEQKRIAGEISRLQIQLQKKLLSPEQKAGLLRKLEESETAYQDIFVRINRRDPKAGERRFPGPFGYADIRQELLGEGTALVEFILGEEYSFAFLATKETLALAKLPAAKNIFPLVSNYLRFLNHKERKEFKAKKGGQRLYELLLGKFHTHLQNGITKIIIVPDGFLYYLPFESVVMVESTVSGKRRPGSYLIERYEISYGPSASGIIQLRERRKEEHPGKDLLAIANPTLLESQKLIYGLPYDLPDLRFALQEVRSISRFFDSQRATILLGSQTEEGRLKSLDWRKYRIVHFAAHGVVEDDTWKHSGLLLWREEESEEDGFFQPRDIYLLKLASDLVVLSACQTGKGSLESGEGLLGFAGAFLFAGADSVIVSQWNIVDQSTSRFMEDLYKSLTEGKPIPQALREAKVKMIHSEYSHPYFWAPFILIGDPFKAAPTGNGSRSKLI